MAINEEDTKSQEEIFRFIQDLEFVQCLANPLYLKYLSDKGYLDDDNFINYLNYLLYFKKAEYMKYITFERCLLFLELLQYKEFREQLKQNNYAQIPANNGFINLSYAECLNNFILNKWQERSIQEINNENNIQNENKDEKSNINI